MVFLIGISCCVTGLRFELSLMMTVIIVSIMILKCFVLTQSGLYLYSPYIDMHSGNVKRADNGTSNFTNF